MFFFLQITFIFDSTAHQHEKKAYNISTTKLTNVQEYITTRKQNRGRISFLPPKYIVRLWEIQLAMYFWP